MAIQLDFERVFRAPFCPQPFAFYRFADRAIALLPVNFVKWVALFAVGFAGIQRGNGYAVLQRVFPDGHKLEVLRVNAGAIAADVVDDQPISNFAISKEPRHAMRAPSFAAKIERSVSVAIKRALPNMALALLRPFLVKAFDFSHTASLMVSRVTWCERGRQHALV